MTQFFIRHCDPNRYKDEIIAFWEKYLPGAPRGRFSWLAQGNPAGAAVWLLAFEKNSNKLAGTISIMPRIVTSRDNEYLAGIVGDFMVAEEHRVYGPTIQLVKSLIKEYKGLGFDFLYTLPNRKTEKLMYWVGFKSIGGIKRYIKYHDYGIILKRYTSRVIANLISPTVNSISYLLSKETYIGSNLLCEKVEEFNRDYELFSNELKYCFPVVGDRSASYIKWRYLKNPLYKFNINILKSASDGSISGFVIYTVMDNGINVFDIMAKDELNFKRVFAHFLKQTKRAKFRCVSINVFQGNPLLPHIRKYLFFDRHDVVPLLYYSDSVSLPDGWLFFSGDRNI